ncbi:MAG: hypothetical protein ABIK79_01535 [Chloroflexota bacterium]|nr:hypothetical protein [Anaerolineae bacterium]
MQSHVWQMVEGDWGAVRSIYEEGIATGNATIETEAPGWWVSSEEQEAMG